MTITDSDLDAIEARAPRNGYEAQARAIRRHCQPTQATFLAAERYDRMSARCEREKAATEPLTDTELDAVSDWAASFVDGAGEPFIRLVAEVRRLRAELEKRG